MISRYMGPHYGNNVALPSAGVYHMTLLVSPPVAARHLEYDNLWLQPHRVSLTFRWVLSRSGAATFPLPVGDAETRPVAERPCGVPADPTGTSPS